MSHIWYDALVSKQVHASASAMSSSDVWLEKKLRLPFVPQIGMCLHVGDWGSDVSWSAKIEEVWWCVSEELFRCFTEPDKQFYNAILYKWPESQIPSLDEIVSVYVEDGWKVRKR